MNRMVWFSFFAIFILVLGCIGPGPQPTTNDTNATSNATKNQTFVITGSTNYTVANNISTPDVIKNMTIMQVAIASNYTYNAEENIYVFFIYVGDGNVQADSILVKKGDADVLIDTGPASASQNLVEFLKARGVDDLEIVLLTHADQDHYGATPAVMGNFSIGKVLWSGRTYGDSGFQKLLDELKDEKLIPLQAPIRGDTFSINNITFTMLNPVEKSFAAVDEDAIVLKVTDRNFCVLLTSDIVGGGLDDVMKKTDIKCDIVEIPRSGADQLSGGALVRNLLISSSAKVAIISGSYKEDPSSKGDFRKPLFEMLEQNNILHYENYFNGSIRIMSDGSSYDIDFVH